MNSCRNSIDSLGYIHRCSRIGGLQMLKLTQADAKHQSVEIRYRFRAVLFDSYVVPTVEVRLLLLALSGYRR